MCVTLAFGGWMVASSNDSFPFSLLQYMGVLGLVSSGFAMMVGPKVNDFDGET